MSQEPAIVVAVRNSNIHPDLKEIINKHLKERFKILKILEGKDNDK